MEVTSFHVATESEYSEHSGSLSRSSSLRSSISGGSYSTREGKIGWEDLNSYRCIRVFETKERITCMAMDNAEDPVVFVGSESGSIRLTRGGQAIHGDDMRSGAMVKAFVAGGNHELYSGHHDQKIRIWSRRGPRDRVLTLRKTLPTLKNQLMNLVVRDFNVQKGTVKPHVDAITSLALSAEENLLYSGSWDKTVKVWRISDFECAESIEGHDDAVNAIATGAYGMLFTGSADRTVKIWRLVGWKGKSRRRCIHRLVVCVKVQNPVNAVALSGDESILYAGTSRGDVNYWVMDDKSLQICSEGALCGHRRSVLCLWCGGKFVCSGSADNTVRIWKTEPGIGGAIGHSCLAVLKGHSAPVKCITASPLLYSCLITSPDDRCGDIGSDDDGTNACGVVVYSGSFDGTMRIWWVNCNSR